MKRIAATLGLTVASTTIASAADLPARVYTKAPVAAQIYDWTGFYIGANVGVGVSRAPSAVDVPSINLGDSIPSSVVGTAGAVGGGQLGYNWQSGNIVLGLETDIQGASLQTNRTCTFECNAPDSAVTYNQHLDWFGTVRGRVGWATGAVLGYVTGGLAYGGVKTDNVVSIGDIARFSWDQTRTGWTIGSGVEASLDGNWTGKIEYLYIDLGSQNGTVFVAGQGNVTSSLDIREHIFRAGVNYRFGENRTAAAEPIADWRGLYIGGNAGEALALSPSSLSFTTNVSDPVFETYNQSPRGFIGGGQLGYNWQSGAFVYGLETDIQGSTQRGGGACLLFCWQGTLTENYEQRMSWLGTTRGRLGYATGDALFYVTGGLAYGNVTTKVSELFTTINFDGSFSHTKTGYAVGAGIETKFNPFGLFGRNWSAKTEYLYADLGSVTDRFTTASAGGIIQLNHTYTTRVEEHIFRTGLNYHFDSTSP